MNAPLLVLALAVPALAVPARAGAKNPDTYVQLSISDIATLDPAFAYDTASHNVIANIYEYLVAYKKDSLTEFEPRLASRVPTRANGLLSEDGRTYAFPIRKGVRFQDGSPLTPEDVRYSLNRFLLTDRAAGPSPLLLEPLLGRSSTRDKDGRPLDSVYSEAAAAVTVSGDNVILRLPRPFAPLLSVLANFAPVLSKAWCVRNGEWDGSAAGWKAHNNPERNQSGIQAKANGTGPFQLERWNKDANEVVLSRFDSYWRGPAKLKGVVIRSVDDFQTRRLMLKAGDADSIYAPRMFYSQLAGMPEVRITDDLENLEAGPVMLFTFDIDVKSSPYVGSGKLDGKGIPPDFFADPDVRKAFAYAIDYDAYVQDILRGKGHSVQGIIPHVLIPEKKGLASYHLDLEKAKEHLMKARGGKVWETGFEFSIVFTGGSPAAEVIGQMLKRNVERLAPRFKINLQPVQWSTYLDHQNHRRLPLFLAQWLADYPDPHDFVFPFLHSRGHYAVGQGFSDPTFDSMIEAAAGELDPAKRIALYHKILERAHEYVPHVCVAGGARYRAEREWVKGWRFSPMLPDAPYGADYYALSKE